ncbi:Homeodomain-like protein [Cynara cardunculus var. scolymus]|uniref:Homeodomain-like protein n=1 Tax=Cynara cardunculus var. scolymus TaxID=59895 RepID=A0A103Y7Y1_CYNCS|nr:Homeodomain-like protein [Cynara cardunculus var. scolymus]
MVHWRSAAGHRTFGINHGWYPSRISLDLPLDPPHTEEQSSRESKLEFSEDEKNLITRMYKLVGDRWSLIAGRIPGRTAVEIKEYWTSRVSAND